MRVLQKKFKKFDCHCYATTSLSHEVLKYCITKDGAVEKLSCVVVGAKNFECGFVADEDIGRKKLIAGDVTLKEVLCRQELHFG